MIFKNPFHQITEDDIERLKNEKIEEGWFVDWEVIYSLNEKTTGRIRLLVDELKVAFRLSESQRCFGKWLIDKYNASSAEQGKYIRRGDFLNIPCPGTGHDGDPNISIEIDDEIREAVRQLLK